MATPKRTNVIATSPRRRRRIIATSPSRGTGSRTGSSSGYLGPPTPIGTKAPARTYSGGFQPVPPGGRAPVKAQRATVKKRINPTPKPPTKVAKTRGGGSVRRRAS